MSEPAGSHVAWSGRYLAVAIETWPDIGECEVVRKHDAVAIVPITPTGDVLLVRQFRPPVRTSLIEIPAGLLDVDDETPRDAAVRELAGLARRQRWPGLNNEPGPSATAF